MSTVISIIAVILIIGLLIFIHEFGHYFVAKMNGIGVTEFSIGLGPKMFSWVRNGTQYTVRWIPFGGYCAMLGEEAAFQTDGEVSEAVVSDEEHAFSKKSVWARLSVIFAGPLFNLILALLLAFLLVALVGTTTSVISGVVPDYPAEEAGLRKGDEIVKLDHTPTHIFSDISLYMTMHEGDKEIKITYKRDGEKHETVLKPRYSEEDRQYLIGILASNRIDHLSIGNVLKYGFYEFAFDTGAVIKSLGMLVTGKASLNDLSGPVGMAGMVNGIVEEVEEDTKGQGAWTTAYWIFINLLSFTVLISANLGIMNLLPIPGMDGGRILLLLVEAIRGKPLNKKAEGIVTLIGFVLLLLLMVAVFFNDIRKLFFI